MKKHLELKNYFAQQNDIEFALIFGSVASGRDSPISDIDVAVYFREGEDILKLGDRQIDITCAIMKLYRINRVDVVVLNLANPFLRFQVTRKSPSAITLKCDFQWLGKCFILSYTIKYGRLLYTKDEKVFYKFKAVSLGMHQDIKPMYDLYERVAEIKGGFVCYF